MPVEGRITPVRSQWGIKEIGGKSEAHSLDCSSSTIEVRHGKTDLCCCHTNRVATLSYLSYFLLLFSMNLECLQPSQIITCSWCHTKRRIGGAPPANSSFSITMTKILRYILSWHGSSDGYDYVMNYVHLEAIGAQGGAGLGSPWVPMD